ncbi:MAG: alpha/beta fold hydrolase [Dehalococcoidia bacterium]|nr:alpha/beta fold hydrolase [Dehalococcoidia bacterium]
MRISVNGFQAHYRTWGHPDSPPLLLLHSTSFGAWMWEPIARLLDSSYYVVATDQRGHGDSEVPDDGYSLEQLGDDMHSIVSELGLEGAPAVGHSSGATTLLVAEARHNGTFSKLLLIEPIMPPPAALRLTTTTMIEQARRRRTAFASREEMFTSFRDRPPFDTWTDEALRLYAQQGTRPEDGGVALKTPPEYEARIYEALLRLEPDEHLARVGCPALLVRGEQSGPHHVAMFDQVQKALGADTEIVAGSGHFVPQEQPSTVVSLVKRFIG